MGVHHYCRDPMLEALVRRCCMNRLQDDTRPLRLPSGRDRLGARLPELEHPVENPASDHRLPSLSLEVLRP